MTTHYVVGFPISDDGISILLMHKKRPDWQNGYINGIGGKMEGSESPETAMRREAKEEVTNLDMDWGKAFIQLRFDDAILNCFSVAVPWDNLMKVKAKTDEQVTVYDIEELAGVDVIPNLNFLIPMARYHLFNQGILNYSSIRFGGKGQQLSKSRI